MIELDNGPIAITIVIVMAYLFPILYSFFIDRNNDRK